MKKDQTPRSFSLPVGFRYSPDIGSFEQVPLLGGGTGISYSSWATSRYNPDTGSFEEGPALVCRGEVLNPSVSPSDDLRESLHRIADHVQHRLSVIDESRDDLEGTTEGMSIEPDPNDMRGIIQSAQVLSGRVSEENTSDIRIAFELGATMQRFVSRGSDPIVRAGYKTVVGGRASAQERRKYSYEDFVRRFNRIKATLKLSDRQICEHFEKKDGISRTHLMKLVKSHY